MLKTTPVSKCLEKKLKFAGFEITDLLFILFFLAILNFLFGAIKGKLFIVWLPTLLITLILRIGKHGKPDNYLVHKIKFYFRPKVLRAFPASSQFKVPPELKKKGLNNE